MSYDMNPERPLESWDEQYPGQLSNIGSSRPPPPNWTSTMPGPGMRYEPDAQAQPPPPSSMSGGFYREPYPSSSMGGVPTMRDNGEYRYDSDVRGMGMNVGLGNGGNPSMGSESYGLLERIPSGPSNLGPSRDPKGVPQRKKTTSSRSTPSDPNAGSRAALSASTRVVKRNRMGNAITPPSEDEDEDIEGDKMDGTMVDVDSVPTVPVKPKIRRNRIARACVNCRQKKTKCDGAHPMCSQCVAMHFECAYDYQKATGSNVIVPTTLLTDVEEHQRALDTRQSESEERIKRLEWQLEAKLKQAHSASLSMTAQMLGKSTDSEPSPADGRTYGMISGTGTSTSAASGTAGPSPTNNLLGTQGLNSMISQSMSPPMTFRPSIGNYGQAINLGMLHTPQSSRVADPSSSITTSMDAQAATGGRDDSRRRGGSSDPQLGLHREYFGSASVTNFTALILKGLSLSTAEVYNDDDHHDDENASALQKEEARISRQRRTLPHPTQAEAMLQVFFANTHQLYPFIHEATYKRDYVKLYESLSLIYPEQLLYGGEPVIDLTGAELTEDQELHLSLIEAVFAMVENTALGGFLEGTLTQATRSMRGRFARRVPRLLAEYQTWPECLRKVQCLLVLALLQHTMDLRQACQAYLLVGAAVRTAYVIGMPEWTPPQASAIEVELRTRSWACCFTLDKLLSATLGRKAAISSSVEFHRIPEALPDEDPKLTEFLTMSIPVYGLLSDVHEEVQGGSMPGFADVTATFRQIAFLESRFAAWGMSLPPNLALDQDYNIADARAVILGLRALTVRTIFHRPFLALAVKQDVTRSERSLAPVAGLLPYSPIRAQEAYLHDFIGQSLRALLDSAAQVIRILNATQGTNVLSTQWYILFYAVNAFMMIAAALSLDLSRWTGILPGGTSHLLELLQTCRHYVANIGEEGRSSLAVMDRILGALFKPAENSLTLLRPPSPSDMPMPPDEQTAALLEAIANPDMAQFHDWTSVLSQFITPDDTFGDMDQLMELFPK